MLHTKLLSVVPFFPYGYKFAITELSTNKVKITKGDYTLSIHYDDSYQEPQYILEDNEGVLTMVYPSNLKVAVVATLWRCIHKQAIRYWGEQNDDLNHKLNMLTEELAVCEYHLNECEEGVSCNIVKY